MKPYVEVQKTKVRFERREETYTQRRPRWFIRFLKWVFYKEWDAFSGSVDLIQELEFKPVIDHYQRVEFQVMKKKLEELGYMVKRTGGIEARLLNPDEPPTLHEPIKIEVVRVNPAPAERKEDE